MLPKVRKSPNHASVPNPAPDRDVKRTMEDVGPRGATRLHAVEPAREPARYRFAGFACHGRFRAGVARPRWEIAVDRHGAAFGHQRDTAAARHQLRDLRVRIRQIPEASCRGRTHTGIRSVSSRSGLSIRSTHSVHFFINPSPSPSSRAPLGQAHRPHTMQRSSSTRMMPSAARL